MIVLFLGLFLSTVDTLHIKAAATAYQAGQAALLHKQPTAAIAQLNKAIAIEPTFLEAYKALIAAHLAEGDRLGAADAMTRLLQIDPLDHNVRLSLAQTLLAEHQWDRSLAQFSFVLQNEPLNAEALLGFATAAKSLGLDARASEALIKGRTHYPSDKRFRTDAEHGPN